jgi:hypothetical protein
MYVYVNIFSWEGIAPLDDDDDASSKRGGKGIENAGSTV